MKTRKSISIGVAALSLLLKARRVTLTSVRVHDLLVVLCFAGAWVVTFPAPFWLAGAGLDNSWIVALHLAVANGLIFGRDILFSYGPLGYLFFPLGLSVRLWVEAVIFRLAMHTLFYLALMMITFKSENRIFNAVLLAFSGTMIEVVLQEPYLLAAVVFLFSFYLIAEGHCSYFPLLSALAAVTPFFRIDIGLASLVTIILGSTCLYAKGYRRLALVSLASWVAVFVLAGIALTKSFETLASFTSGSYQLAIGFGPAMAISGPFWQLYVAMIAWGALGLYFLLAVLVRKDLPVKFLSLGLLFFSFKEGFVRLDLGHVIIFFGAWSLFFGLTLIRERNRFIKGYCSILFVLLLVSGGWLAYNVNSAGTFFPVGTYVPANVAETINTLSQPSVASQMFASALSNVRSQYGLSNSTASLLTNRSVDIFPWDVSMAPAYEMEWDPRPIFQSYSAYTPYLDNLNARHFLGSNAPEFVLYQIASIDDRYPLFDEPLTLRALMCNYQEIGFDNGFMILEKVDSSCGSPRAIQSIDTTFGDTVSVPSNYNGYVFAEVRLRFNLIGLTESLLYKAPLVFVKLNFADGSTGTYRFESGNAMDGLVVSAIPNDLFGGAVRQIRGITFITPGAYAFDSHIQVEFVRVAVIQDDSWVVVASGLTQSKPIWQLAINGKVDESGAINNTAPHYVRVTRLRARSPREAEYIA